jgi:hypothetical protein
MSTIKISELPKFTTINANTSNTLFVGIDIPSAQTFQFSAGTLAEGLFANTALVVGNNRIVYPSTTAQFSGVANGYLQLNLQNFANGIYSSSDFVASTIDSDNSTKFIDMGIDGPLYNDPVNYAAFKPYDGYLYVHGPSDNSPQGNLILGTASSNAIIKFMVGGTMNGNIAGWMTKTGLKLNTQSYITFSDNTLQSTAAAPYADSNGVNLTQNTNITSAFTQANSAFTKANNALANTTGTFAGNLTITGAVVASSGNIGSITIANNSIYSALTSVDMTIGQSSATANLVINRTTNITKDINVTGNLVTNGTFIDFNNTTFDANTALVQITGTTAAFPASNTNYMLQITGKANTVTRLVLDSFGQNTYPVVVGRMGRGSSLLPAAVANNDVMMRIVGNGYTGTQFPGSSPTKIDFVAAENFTDSARGTRIDFYNTPVGSNVITRIASFNADSVTFTGHVEPQKGFIYTPTVYPGAQTAITIDHANNSVIRAQTSSGLTVTLSNLLAGKEVVAWITNTSGFSQTFTHGLSAINSTLNATTYSIPSTSTILVRYMSIDGTLQNTLCSVTHA